MKDTRMPDIFGYCQKCERVMEHYTSQEQPIGTFGFRCYKCNNLLTKPQKKEDEHEHSES